MFIMSSDSIIRFSHSEHLAQISESNSHSEHTSLNSPNSASSARGVPNVKIVRAVPEELRMQMAATRDWNIDCKVYVGEIGYGAAKQDLEELFSKYGPLKNVWVARNPPGFAFVEFEDPMDAQDAADALDGSRINGRRARVEMSSGKSRWGRGGPPMRRGGGGGGGGGGYRGGRDSYRSRGRSRSRSPRRRSPSPSTRRRTPSPRRGRYSRSRSPRQSREKSPRRDRSPRNRSPRDRSISPVGGGNRDRSPERE